MAIDGDVILNRFSVLAPQFSGDDNAHNSSRGAGVLGRPGITRRRSEMKLLAWKTPKHGLALGETKEAGKSSQLLQQTLNRFAVPIFCLAVAVKSVRAAFQGGLAFFPRLFFSGDRPGPCHWGCKRDLQPRKSMYL